jgi:hypothetical protein
MEHNEEELKIMLKKLIIKSAKELNISTNEVKRMLINELKYQTKCK